MLPLCLGDDCRFTVSSFQNSTVSRPVKKCVGILIGISLRIENARSYPKDMCSMIFIASLFIISRTWKQPRCSSTEEWIRKDYYSDVKNNSILKFEDKWTELDKTISSEVTQTLKDKYNMYSLTSDF